MASKALHGKYGNYHYCIVRECKNTSIKNPKKLWIKVPNDETMRKTWLQLAKRDPVTLSTGTAAYFCEDHFNLESDMDNYVQYKIMGSVKRIRMKPNCVPTQFDCQMERKHKQTLVTNDEDVFKKRVCPIEQSTLSISSVKRKRNAAARNQPKEGRATEIEVPIKQEKTDSGKEDIDAEKLFDVFNQEVKMEIEYEENEIDDASLYENDPLENMPDDVKSEPIETELQQVPSIMMCNTCQEEITGRVYWCVQCVCCVCCDACSSSVHAAHYMLAVPLHARNKHDEIKNMLDEIRRMFGFDTGQNDDEDRTLSALSEHKTDDISKLAEGDNTEAYEASMTHEDPLLYQEEDYAIPPQFRPIKIPLQPAAGPSQAKETLLTPLKRKRTKTKKCQSTATRPRKNASSKNSRARLKKPKQRKVLIEVLNPTMKEIAREHSYSVPHPFVQTECTVTEQTAFAQAECTIAEQTETQTNPFLTRSQSTTTSKYKTN